MLEHPGKEKQSREKDLHACVYTREQLARTELFLPKIDKNFIICNNLKWREEKSHAIFSTNDSAKGVIA